MGMEWEHRPGKTGAHRLTGDGGNLGNENDGIFSMNTHFVSLVHDQLEHQ